MTETYDVIVVGGGAVGAACARELALSGRRVVVLDPGGDSGQAWQAAAGMLAPQIEADQRDPLFELGLAARDHCRVLAEALRNATGRDIGFWQEGIAHLAEDETDVATLRSKLAWQREAGHPVEWLEPDEVRRRWPWLSPTAGALWAPREGALDPIRLVEALREDAVRLGASLTADAGVTIECRNERAVGVEGVARRYRAADVVVAAGAWSGRLYGLPRPLSVEPARGQMAALPWPTGVPRAIMYHRSGYVLTRHGEAVVGSTMEYAGFRKGVTVGAIERILAAAGARSPLLDNARPLRTWAGFRPMTPDGLPIIGREPRMPGLWYATGHGRNGILLAGITGLLIRRLMDGEAVAELRPFSPDRFWRW